MARYPLPGAGLYNAPVFQTFLANHPTFARIARTGSGADVQRFLSNNPTIASRYMAILNPAKPAAQGPVSATPTQTAAEQIAADPSKVGVGVDWVDELNSLFRQNGLDTLADTLVGLVQSGYQGSALTLALQDSKPYKDRFSANEKRKAAGLPVLSPAEYLAAESSYRQVMQTAGLPVGFYDHPDDFSKWIAADTSPAEIQGRVSDAVQLAKNTDPGYRKMISDTFGVGLTDGDIAAFVLDQKRALPVLEKTVNSVGVADAARRQGLAYSANRANQLTEAGVTADQANQAYGQVAEMTSAYGRAGAALGDSYDQTNAEDESLLGLASAKRKRQKIEDTFNAYNSGSSRTASGALKRDDSQSY